MTLNRLPWPMATAYWRASFRQLSTASEPPETKNTRSMPAGISPARRRARSSAGAFSKCRR